MNLHFYSFQEAFEILCFIHWSWTSYQIFHSWMILFREIISLTFPRFNQDLNVKKCTPLTGAHLFSFNFHLLKDVKTFSSILKSSVELTSFLGILFNLCLHHFCTCLLNYVKWARWLCWQGVFPRLWIILVTLWVLYHFSTLFLNCICFCNIFPILVSTLVSMLAVCICHIYHVLQLLLLHCLLLIHQRSCKYFWVNISIVDLIMFNTMV